MALNKFRFWRKESKKAEPVEYEDAVSFEDAFLLAKAMTDAVDKRNEYTSESSKFGGFDNFAEVWQHADDGIYRREYDELVRQYNEARKAFDDQVKNKQGLVQKLESNGDIKLAKRIREMFSVR